MSTAVLQMPGLLDETPHSAKKNTQTTVHQSHDRLISALEPLNFPAITSLPPMEWWSRITLDVATVKKALGNLVTIEKDTDYPEENFYRCNGLWLFNSSFTIEDGCGMTEDDALMSYMEKLMSHSPTDFMHNWKRLEWIEEYRQFHELG